MFAFVFFFFFSSRRRHTRLQGDWSSDVCSSDLGPAGTGDGEALRLRVLRAPRYEDAREDRVLLATLVDRPRLPADASLRAGGDRARLLARRVGERGAARA